jgi:heme exporter protein A
MTVLAAQPLWIDTAGTAVVARDLCKSIDEWPILRRISFTVMPGEFLALLGANGAGKSTLLKVLATLAPPTDGQLLLFGKSAVREMIAVRGRIGLIGHQAMLYRDLSAHENLTFFGKLYGVERPDRRAEQLLEMLGLADRGADAVKTFSRGMTQRVAIARALMHDPELLLADEPFDGLDAPSARSLENLLAQLHQSGKTIILANHDIPQSLRLARRAMVLRQGLLAIDRASAELGPDEVLEIMESPLSTAR